MAPGHPAHFDPYYNWHLCENFDPKQADFSKEYLDLQSTRMAALGPNVLNTVSSYSFELDSIFQTIDHDQNGVIGSKYRRIRVHIGAAEATNDPLVYQVKGKSVVGENRCDFTGKITLLSLYEFEEYAIKGEGTLFAHYEFFEDSTQEHVGVFKGTFECDVIVNHDAETIEFSEISMDADGYYNRTYVGTWQQYGSDRPLKCIWGDYRLPFTFDFDCGDGEMVVCDKYVENGWQSHQNRSGVEQNGRWWR